MEKISFLQSSLLLVKARKEALGLWIWCSIVASLLVGRGFPPIAPTLLSILSTAFIALAVYVYNDVVDMDADKYNIFKKDRPLASGIVSRRDAIMLVYISSIIGLSSSLLLDYMSFFFNLLFYIVFGLYSYPRVHLKKRFLVKESVISSGLIIIGLSVNYAILGVFSPMVLAGFLLFAMFAFCAMPTGFDSTDVQADIRQGVKSIASVLPVRQRMQLSMAGMLLVMTITPFTYAYFGFNFLLPVSVLFTGSLFLWLMYPLMTSINPIASKVDADVIMKARKVIVVFIFVICGCVILGALNFGYIL